MNPNNRKSVNGQFLKRVADYFDLKMDFITDAAPIMQAPIPNPIK